MGATFYGVDQRLIGGGGEIFYLSERIFLSVYCKNCNLINAL